MQWERMTPFEALSLLIAFLGIMGVSVTLLYLARQTKHLVDSLAVASFQGVIASTLDVDRIFVDFPDARPYFYSGVQIALTDPDFNRVAAIAETLLDLFDTFLYLARYNSEYSEFANKYIVDMFLSSPILRHQLELMHEYYPSDLVVLKGQADRLLEGMAENILARDDGERIKPK